MNVLAYRLIIADDHPLFRGALREAVTGLFERIEIADFVPAVLRELAPRFRIYAAEVETAAPLAASLAAGEPRTVDYRPTFVDGIGSKMVFAGMFERARKLLDGSSAIA